MNEMTLDVDIKSVDIRYAGFGKRLKAFGYDYLIIFTYIVVLLGVNYGLILAGGGLTNVSPLFASPLVKDAVAFLTLILPVMLYFSLQESSARQASWGKRKIGIRVVNAKGDKLTRLQAFIRALFKFLPWQIAHTCIYQIEGFPFEPVDPTPMVWLGFGVAYLLVAIYIASALISKSHRTPYDGVSGAFVIESDL